MTVTRGEIYTQRILNDLVVMDLRDKFGKQACSQSHLTALSNVQVDAWKRHLRIKYFGNGSYCGRQLNSNGAKLRLLTVYVDDSN